MVIGAFALVGLAVTTWVAVRLPFWIRDIRREDREAETARVAAVVDPFARLNESEQRLRETMTEEQGRSADEAVERARAYEGQYREVLDL